MQQLFIGWSTYFFYVLVLLVVYYLFAGLVYYRQELQAIFNRKHPAVANIDGASTDSHGQAAVEATTKTSNSALLFPMAGAFRDEVTAYIEQAANDGIQKTVLIESLAVIAARYPSLASSSYEPDLQQTIAKLSDRYCGVQLTDNDFLSIWPGQS